MTMPTKKEIHDYLVALRDSGETNMWGAVPYLEAEFDMSKGDAKQALFSWMDDMTKGVTP